MSWVGGCELAAGSSQRSGLQLQAAAPSLLPTAALSVQCPFHRHTNNCSSGRTAALQPCAHALLHEILWGLQASWERVYGKPGVVEPEEVLVQAGATPIKGARKKLNEKQISALALIRTTTELSGTYGERERNTFPAPATCVRPLPQPHTAQLSIKQPPLRCRRDTDPGASSSFGSSGQRKRYGKIHHNLTKLAATSKSRQGPYCSKLQPASAPPLPSSERLAPFRLLKILPALLGFATDSGAM